MQRLFTFIKQWFTKKCDEPLHNHHDGCPECDMPWEHLYTNKNETVYTCYQCDKFDLRDDSGEYPNTHWENTYRGYESLLTLYDTDTDLAAFSP